MKIKEYTINSISEYLDIITSFKTEHSKLWFRGLASEDYKLMPTIYRSPYTYENEQPLLHQFKARAVRFLHSIPRDDMEWFFIMQHHSTPTRLLDWSESALVALAFAVQYRSNEHKDKNAVVWCLNPKELNSNIRFSSYDYEPIPNICEAKEVQTMYNSMKPTYPIAIIGPQNTDRIVAQKGVFTFFPNKESFDLESLPTAGKFLVKLNIPKEKIDSLSENLYYVGITESSLFPELDSISKELKREIKE